MDIVDKILKEVKGLTSYYEKHMSYFYDEEGNPEIEIDLGTKFGALNMAFRFRVKEPDFKGIYIEKILELLEKFAQDASEEELGQLEVMFLEDLVWWAEDKESEGAQKYGDYFLSCLGPKCRELCKRNKEFWDKLNRERQKQIDEHYAQLQREYEERKKK